MDDASLIIADPQVDSWTFSQIAAEPRDYKRQKIPDTHKEKDKRGTLPET